MHRRPRIACLGVIALGLTACVGGGGGLAEGIDTFDPPPRTNESAPRRTDPAPASTDPAHNNTEPRTSRLDIPIPRSTSSSTSSTSSSGSSNQTPSTPGSSDCAGIYSCVSGTKTESRSVTKNASGNCVYNGVEAQPDGRLMSNGVSVGTWAGDPSTGVLLNITGQTPVVCKKLTTG
jgi:hypothetical protein